MRTRQIRPEKKDYEFELHLFNMFDEIQNKYYILFDFRTTKIFRSFLYKINVEVRNHIDKNEIEFNVEGLSAPNFSFTEGGYADFQYRLYNFPKNEMNIRFLKSGTFSFNYIFKFKNKSIEVVKKSRKSFINIIIHKD
jgi:hypothetical protein